MEDVRPKAVFSNFFRGVWTEVKSLSGVQFMECYITKLPLAICVNFQYYLTSFTHRLFIGNNQ